MNISTFSRYGLRALLRMAITIKENGNTPVSLKSIAEQEHISLKYLENIFAVLRKNNIIKAQRGKFGGYILNQPAEQISIYDILKALEGKMTLTNCLIDKNQCTNDPSCCTTRNLWQDINNTIIDKLQQKTLEDLIHDNRSAS